MTLPIFDQSKSSIRSPTEYNSRIIHPIPETENECALFLIPVDRLV